MRRTEAATAASRIVLALALLAAPAVGRAQTAVTPDVGNPFALGTTAVQAGSTITIDGGTRAGANLFHSFNQFSLGLGVTARWTANDPGGVAHVVNRVTGGEVSRIDGALDSTALPNAAFWFVNTAGIVFGPGAQVNVPGAAHFSTATELRFADGGTFAVTASDGSTLSVAPPQAWGFVGGEGAIAIDGVGLAFTSGSATLSFTASDVGVLNSTLGARGLDFTAVGDGPLEVLLSDPLAAPATGAVELLGSQVVGLAAAESGAGVRVSAGDVVIDRSFLTSDAAGGGAGGDIAVSASRFTLRNSAFVGSSARGAGRGGDVRIAAGEIEMNGGGVFATTSGPGQGGEVQLLGNTVVLENFASISSSSIGEGSSGSVRVEANTFVANGGILTSNATGAGDAGDVIVDAALQDWIDGVATVSVTGTGTPGDVFLFGQRIFIAGGAFGSSPGAAANSGGLLIDATESVEAIGTVLTASSLDDGEAGVIAIRSPDIYVDDTFIQTNSFGSGAAGVILLDGQRVVVVDSLVSAEARGDASSAPGFVQIRGSEFVRLSRGATTSIAYSAADGGSILIEGGDIFLDDTDVASDTFGDGDAGSVEVRATGDLLVSNGLVSSDSTFNGDAGDVVLQGRTITIDTSAKVSSDALDVGDGGTVTLIGGDIRILDGASVTSKSQNTSGDAGSVFVTGDLLELNEGFISSDTFSLGDAGSVSIDVDQLVLTSLFENSTYISSDSLFFGNAGGVFIEARTITLTGQTYISSNAFSQGSAGVVEIATDTLLLSPGAFIASDTQGEGSAGDVFIRAGELTLEGEQGFLTYISSDSLDSGDAGTVTIEAGRLRMTNNAFISSDTYFAGAGGDVFVAADTITLETEASIRSGALAGSGNAGNVFVRARSITLDSEAAITSDAFGDSFGDAGLVDVEAGTVSVRDGARISTGSRGGGDAGAVLIAADDIVVEGGEISSSAEFGSSGASGDVIIAAGRLTVLEGGSVSTLSNNTNIAGVVDIEAGSVRIDGEGASISSENQEGNPDFLGIEGLSGDAGSVRIVADAMTIANGGSVSTNSFAGAAGDIGIFMARPALLVLEGADAPGSIQTSSGSTTGGRITISDPLAIISNGGSILALGELQGANVVIQSRYFVNSTDRVNTVAVDGQIELQTGLYDVSSGVVSRDLSVLDASRVLRGQCPAVRSTGSVSQLITRPVGPYVREVAPEGLNIPILRRAPAPGACS